MNKEKKQHLLQLRVEKSMLDRLNVAAKQLDLPLSVMLRSWFAEKLVQSENVANRQAEHWQEARFQEILSQLDDFEEGPYLVAHAYTAHSCKLSIEDIETHKYLLSPFYFRTPMYSRILQSGLEVERRYTEKLLAKSRAFKTGQLECIASIPSESHQIMGSALDRTVVETVEGLSQFYENLKLELPYKFRFTILNAQNFALVDRPILASSLPLPTFTSNEVRLTEIVIETFEQTADTKKIAEHAIDVLDELWNATGQKYSRSFDNNKQWILK